MVVLRRRDLCLALLVLVVAGCREVATYDPAPFSSDAASGQEAGGRHDGAADGAGDAGLSSDGALRDAGAVDSIPALDASPIDAAPPIVWGPGCEQPEPVADCSGDWCFIPAGCFTMGDPPDDLCSPGAETLRQVTLTRGFLMAAKEVTQTEYEAATGATPAANTCANCPVERVTWYEAAAYCNELSSQAGLPLCYDCDAATSCRLIPASPYECEGYRLPTDAEWEYAARAGTSTHFPTGDMDPCGDSSVVDGYGWTTNYNSTQQVGLLSANAWGLHDMAGNVWEWVNDVWEMTLGSGEFIDPPGLPSGAKKVFRGGSFNRAAFYARSASRSWDQAANGGTEVGFRCVRTVGARPPWASPFGP